MIRLVLMYGACGLVSDTDRGRATGENRN